MVNKKYKNAKALRQIFLDFFQSQGHEIVPSSSLIPANDPTLLFTNAGMVQFKDVFLGIDKPAYTRAVSIQRCMRAGGKHNDLENVGYTARHHTFFEMLGNFSFGDYFKSRAIHLAWQFLTDILEIPQEKLWVSVYRDDQESEDIWLNEIKIKPNRISRCGEKDNYWQMGDTGPCGPCTEIFYDHGPNVQGGPPGTPEQDGDRFVEVWNIVFMQYDRDLAGNLKPLPKPCVDTGMGLERIAAVMQGVHDNYDIELFQSLLKALAKIVHCNDFDNRSMRVIVDHIRSSAFLISDGVVPSNEGRGYVLRRIIRRASRHGYKLEKQDPFLYKMVEPLMQEMGEVYPELLKSQKLIEKVIEQEEEKFSKTLSNGLKILDQTMSELSQDELPGSVIFQLYDTYGFPPDLTADVAREKGFNLDFAGFQKLMQKQREQSQTNQPFNVDQTQRVHIVGNSEFVGYDQLKIEAQVIALLQNNKPVGQIAKGESGIVVLDQSPFYPEGGGQVGDIGELKFAGGSFRVDDTKKQGGAILHIGEISQGTLTNEAKVSAEVDEANRKAIKLNHSATHLLHEALRQVLGDHVQQKGSLVEARRLRFDFSHPNAMSNEEIRAVEHLVNQVIRDNLTGELSIMSPEEAAKQGALAIFGERYGKRVRVLKLGDFSTEICGGTHVSHTGEIGLFKITAESATASGVRRIEAVTGRAALQYLADQEDELLEVSDLLKTNKANILSKLQNLIKENKSLEKALASAKQALINFQLSHLADQALQVEEIKLLALQLPTVDRDTMRNTLDQLKQQLGTSAILLATVHEDKVQLVAGVSKDCLKYFSAAELLNQVAHQVGGKGGGRADLAQGGGDSPEKLDEAIKSVMEWTKTKLAAKKQLTG